MPHPKFFGADVMSRTCQKSKKINNFPFENKRSLRDSNFKKLVLAKSLKFFGLGEKNYEDKKFTSFNTFTLKKHLFLDT